MHDLSTTAANLIVNIYFFYNNLNLSHEKILYRKTELAVRFKEGAALSSLVHHLIMAWWHSVVFRYCLTLVQVLAYGLMALNYYHYQSPMVTYCPQDFETCLSEYTFERIYAFDSDFSISFTYTFLERQLFFQGQLLNTLRWRQNGHHFPDNNFKCIFLNENGFHSRKCIWNCMNCD